MTAEIPTNDNEQQVPDRELIGQSLLSTISLTYTVAVFTLQDGPKIAPN